MPNPCYRRFSHDPTCKVHRLKDWRPFQDIGFPMRRARFLAAAINRDSVVWVGPASQKLLEIDFFSTFGQAPMLEADDFLVDDESNRDVLLSEIGSRRGLFCSPKVLQDLPMEQLLCPSRGQHALDYHELYKTTHKLGARGSFVVDLSQNPLVRPRCGAWFPTLTCSSLMFSTSSRRFFTNAELDFAMGFPSLPLPLATPYAEGLPDALKLHRRDRATYSTMIGNGMHVAALFSWFGYVFAHCVRRYDIERLVVAVQLPTEGSDNEDLGDGEV
jgi:hypothetical protein